MSLQTIIDNAVSIQISRRKVAGQTVSRSGQIKISSIASNVPWVFTVQMRPGLKYSLNRSLTEEIDRLDRVQISEINIGNTNPALNYITRYQGEYSGSQINQITIDSFSGLDLTLNVSAVTGTASSDIIFEPGDYIQPAGAYKYPYTVTSQVLRGSGSTVTVPLNRPFINQSGYTESGSGIVVGSAVTWQVVMVKKPRYSIVPYDLLQFDDQFELAEVIED